VLLKVVALVTPLRPNEREEAVGLDVWEHGEEAYSSGEGAILVLSDDGGER
jgi:Amt family ammonium transporter